MSQKDHVLAYLAETRALHAAYHNQKENAAWAGVAFYVISIALFLNGFQKIPEVTGTIWFKVFMIAAITTFCGIIVWYLYTQFAAQQVAAEIHAACLRLTALVMTEAEKIDRLDWHIFADTESMPQEQHLPKFILDEITVLRSDKTARAPHLERVAYLLVFTATLAIMLILAMV